jgi:hypothetical protein
MIRTTAFAALSLCALTLANPALAKKSQCNIVGTWTDDYGATANFTSEKGGTATAAAICSGTYKVKVTDLTKTIFDLSGKAKGCPSVTADLTFAQGSCTSASGTLTIEGQSPLNDTWTLQGAPARRVPSHNASLSQGLK